METLQRAGEQMTGGARPRRPLSIQSLCTDHFRRRTPHGGFDAHKAQPGLLFSRPDLREPHTARSPVYLQHTFGTNKTLPQDHSVHSQEYGNLLIYFLTNLLAFTFQRLYNVFILDRAQLSSYIQYQKELSEQQPWRPALYLHIKPGAENNRCRTLPRSKLSDNPPHSRISKISLY